VGGPAVYITNVELWRSDGTAAGTARLADIAPGDPSSEPSELVGVNGLLFFSAYDSAHGRELWRSDGTPQGTTLVKDIAPGLAGIDGLWSSPLDLADVHGTLFFSAYDPVYGRELWKSDGTPQNTTLVKDIMPGSSGSSAQKILQVRPGGGIVFAAADATGGVELWQSNGVDAGTLKLQELAPGPASANPEQFTRAGSKIFFTIDDPNDGQELWAIDLAAINFQPVAMSQTILILADTPASGALGASDPDGDALSYRIVANAGKGAAVIADPSQSLFSYTPNSGMEDGDSFAFVVNDGKADSNNATVNIRVAKSFAYLTVLRR
jgi:ELWxxDGT repeat protein